MKKILLLTFLLLPFIQAVTLEPSISGSTIEVNASDSVDLYGAQFSLAYNPEIIKILEVAKGGFLESDKSQAFFFEGKQKPGAIENIIYLRLGNPEGLSGSGILANVKFAQLKEGDSGVKIQNAILINSKNEKLEVTIKQPAEKTQPNILFAGILVLAVLIALALLYLIKHKMKKNSRK